MRKLLIILLAVQCYAVSPPYYLNGKLSLPEFQRTQQMINQDIYRRLRKVQVQADETSISTGTIATDKTYWLKDIKAEQRYTGAGEIEDDGQGQIDDLYNRKLARLAADDKTYRTVENTSIYFNDGTSDVIQLNGTNGQSDFSGSMTMHSTNTYWNNGVRNNLEINPNEIYFSSLTTKNEESYMKANFASVAAPYPQIQLYRQEPNNYDNALILRTNYIDLKSITSGPVWTGIRINNSSIQRFNSWSNPPVSWLSWDEYGATNLSTNGNDNVLTLHGAVSNSNFLLKCDLYGKTAGLYFDDGGAYDDAKLTNNVNGYKLATLYAGGDANLGTNINHRLGIYNTETPKLYFLNREENSAVTPAYPEWSSAKGWVGYDTTYDTHTLTIYNGLGDIRIEPAAGSTVIGTFTGWISSATYAQQASTATYSLDSDKLDGNDSLYYAVYADVIADTTTLRTDLTTETNNRISADNSIATDTTTLGGRIDSNDTDIYNLQVSTGYLKDNKLGITAKAADSDLLDGLNYDAFVSTMGDTMSGKLIINVSTALTTTNQAGIKITTNVFITGNLGIGTENPPAKLSFPADTVRSGGIDFGGDTYLYRSAPAGLKTDDDFFCSGITLGQVKSADNFFQLLGDGNYLMGDVGINTRTPAYTLDINGTAGIRNSLDMNGNLITNISTSPANIGDASTKGYTDYKINSLASDVATDTTTLGNNMLKKDGSVGLTADWNAGDQRITISTITAANTSGLFLFNDGGKGITVKDVGGITVDMPDGTGSNGQGVNIRQRNASSAGSQPAVAFENTAGVIKGRVGWDGDHSIFIRANGEYVLTVSSLDRVGINQGSPSYALDVTGDIYCTGKLTSVGGNDPPYVLYNYETRQSIIDRVKREVTPDKLNGAVMFFDGSMIELYLPSKGEFRDLQGNLLASVKPIAKTFPTKTKYYFDKETGEVKSVQVPAKKEYKIKKGYELNPVDGQFYKVVKSAGRMIKSKVEKRVAILEAR